MSLLVWLWDIDQMKPLSATVVLSLFTPSIRRSTASSGRTIKYLRHGFCLADIVLILYAEIPSDHLWEFWGLRLNIWAQLTPHNWNLTLTQITTDLLLIFFILTSTVIVPNKSKPKFKVIFLCQVLQCTILVNNSNPFVKVHCSVLFKSVVLFLLLTKHHPIF